MEKEIIIIGAGLTGLTTGFWLTRAGKDIQIIEQQNRIGGQIQTFQENGFIYESGPNTGVVSNPEVAELFEALSPACSLETAREESKRRLIWKGNRFHALPSGLSSAITTPLFSLYDKFRILGEPFRVKGNNPNESVGELTVRRLGKSFLNYAVDPFLSGVYAGDPMQLTTRYALPKLYNLEQEYGSFIRGSIAKAKLPKTERDRLATKKVFSAQGGLSQLTHAMAEAIGNDHITLSASDVTIQPQAGK
jgi:oxygen-dependent protoporphyrinogen oxidase